MEGLGRPGNLYLRKAKKRGKMRNSHPVPSELSKVSYNTPPHSDGRSPQEGSSLGSATPLCERQTSAHSSSKRESGQDKLEYCLLSERTDLELGGKARAVSCQEPRSMQEISMETLSRLASSDNQEKTMVRRQPNLLRYSFWLPF